MKLSCQKLFSSQAGESRTWISSITYPFDFHSYLPPFPISSSRLPYCCSFQFKTVCTSHFPEPVGQIGPQYLTMIQPLVPWSEITERLPCRNFCLGELETQRWVRHVPALKNSLTRAESKYVEYNLIHFTVSIKWHDWKTNDGWWVLFSS